METMEKKKKEMNHEKKIQKRKLQEAISMYHDFVGVAAQNSKKAQERIINNFRSCNSTSYLQQPPPPLPFASAAMPPMHQPQPASHHPYYYNQGVNGNSNNFIL